MYSWIQEYHLCWRRVGSQSASSGSLSEANTKSGMVHWNMLDLQLHWGTCENPSQQVLVASCLLNQNKDCVSSQPCVERGSKAQLYVLYSSSTIYLTVCQHLAKPGSTILLLYCSSQVWVAGSVSTLAPFNVFLSFLASQGTQCIVYNGSLIAYIINLCLVCCNSCNCCKLLTSLDQMMLIVLRLLNLNLGFSHSPPPK